MHNKDDVIGDINESVLRVLRLTSLAKDMYVNYLILTILCNVFYVWCYSNDTANFTDNNLWLTIVKNCEDQPSSDCLKDSIYQYLKDTLNNDGDFEFMEFLRFKKNAIAYNKLRESSPQMNGTVDSPEEESPLEEISRSLKGESRKFLMTHDLEIQLPETFFLGSSLKITPRSFDSTGAELKFEVIPKLLDSNVGQGRTIIKKISKQCVCLLVEGDKSYSMNESGAMSHVD